jgi:hypothetical protein
MKLRAGEQTSNEMPAWAKYLMENPVETWEQLAEYREKFPDAKGEVIMMKIFRLARIPGY